MREAKHISHFVVKKRFLQNKKTAEIFGGFFAANLVGGSCAHPSTQRRAIEQGLLHCPGLPSHEGITMSDQLPPSIAVALGPVLDDHGVQLNATHAIQVFGMDLLQVSQGLNASREAHNPLRY